MSKEEFNQVSKNAAEIVDEFIDKLEYAMQKAKQESLVYMGEEEATKAYIQDVVYQFSEAYNCGEAFQNALSGHLIGAYEGDLDLTCTEVYNALEYAVSYLDQGQVSSQSLLQAENVLDYNHSPSDPCEEPFERNLAASTLAKLVDQVEENRPGNQSTFDERRDEYGTMLGRLLLPTRNIHKLDI